MKIKTEKINIELAYSITRIICSVDNRYIIATNSNKKIIVIDTKIDKCIKSIDLKKLGIEFKDVNNVQKKYLTSDSNK